jgi:hypothetical protein
MKYEYDIDGAIDKLNHILKEHDRDMIETLNSKDQFYQLYDEDDNVKELCSRLADETIVNEFKRRFYMVSDYYDKDGRKILNIIDF